MYEVLKDEPDLWGTADADHEIPKESRPDYERLRPRYTRLVMSMIRSS
jgi:hypothetical protein